LHITIVSCWKTANLASWGLADHNQGKFEIKCDKQEVIKMETKEVNTPEKKISTGAISATIWRNNGTSKRTGGAVEYNTITLQRRYKDKEGNWQTSNSMRVSDLPKATLVLQKAYEYLVLREQGEAPHIEEEEI
jgi:hypothetical protein